MKVLVTGGTGLLSGPVVDHLCRRGADVTIFHRAPSQHGRPVKELAGDRSDHLAFVQAVRENGPWDCLIEMIGGAPGDALSLVEAAKGVVTHVIFCSTTTVYGRPFARVPVVEEGAELRPPSPYGENKLTCECLLREAEARGDFFLTIVRPAHIYNERSLILNSLGNRTSHLDRIRKGRPIIVHDDGRGKWSSLWAGDGAAAIAEAVFVPASQGHTYHLAGAPPFTWNEYHGLLAEALGAPAPAMAHIPAETLARLVPGRTLQCLRTLRYPGVYDCSAAERDLDFRPGVSPRDGLSRNVRYLAEKELIEPWTADEEYEGVLARFMI